jgi:TolB-like protein
MPSLAERLQSALGDAYHVEKELGGGGMSRLFLATEASLHRQVVIKLLPPEFTSEVSAARFKQEIELAAHLQHTNILPVLTAGAKDDLLYYVMPFVSGESLRHRLTREGKLPVPDAVRMLAEIADALAHAHAEGVLHRDIKPENILLLGSHGVLTDFGVARALAESRSGERLTETGMTVGTPGYMSPEQAAGERHLDARADVYALAVVGYEMLTGQPPFIGASTQAVIAALLTTTPRPLTDVRPDIPHAVSDAIARALAKDPNARLRTAAEFRDALQAALGPAPLPAKRNRAVILGAGVLILAAAAVAVVLWPRAPKMLVDPSASVIAVAPFGHASADTALDRLGRDLVVTLSTNLDGVGHIRTVDALTVLAQVPRGDDALSLDQGRALARKLGAASVLYGTLVRSGANVQVDFGLYTADSGRAVARTAIKASLENTQALTDSATWALLREVWRGDRAPTPSLSAVTTRSVPALRAFLEGEQAIVESRWQPAWEAFARASEADSSFWLAYRRYEYARDWVGRPVDPAIRTAYQDHRAELPERERLLVEAGMPDSLIVRLNLRRAVTQRFPDFWPAWMDYADRLVHVGPEIGTTRADAIAALRRVTALNPRFLPAWEHLAWEFALDQDSASLRPAVEELRRLGYGPASREGYGFDVFPTYELALQWLLSWNAGGPVADSAMRSPWSNWPVVAAPAAIALAQRASGANLPDSVLTLRRLEAAEAWASRGRWDSASTGADRVFQRPVSVTLEDQQIEGYRLAVIAAWLGALDPDMAQHHHPTAAFIETLSPGARADLAWADGLLAYARRDRVALTTARNDLRHTSDTLSLAWLDPSLAAFDLDLAGNHPDASRLLADHVERFAKWGHSHSEIHPWMTPVTHLTASRWALSMKDTARALRLLAWHEEVPVLDFTSFTSATLEPLAYLEQARIEDAQGDIEAARAHYQQFLRRYDMPMPAHQHLVDEAKSALERLSAEPTR